MLVSIQNKDSAMTPAVQTDTARESFLAKTWRVLRDIDEAMHTTDLDLMQARVSRLEHELAELKAGADDGYAR
ncbi:MAG TPA: hypothetical protein VEI95_18940 [Acidobacteriota bacterium]|nr:hypothetical protein [Acidobacteriota bacterium]